MGDLLIRRRIMQRLEGEPIPIPYGNAMTTATTTAVYYNTPILMPTGSQVIIDCQLNYSTGGYGSGYTFFYFPNSSNNGIIGRGSNNNNIRYRYSTVGGYYSDSGKFGSKTVTCIHMKPANKTFTLTFSDGTTVDSTQSRPNDTWLARTGTDTLRIHLKQNFYVKRIRQINTGDVLVHDIVPAKCGSKIGFLDVVTNIFYDHTDGDFTITTI